uniref:Uncharacterized protein n=1 Tax=Candidatus Nitrotoga fabula TaxID=2182327 RepID=A0A2X0RGG2_9PROT|nr:protein of unknown function [Candidatus Nitrotoga fabula]
MNIDYSEIPFHERFSDDAQAVAIAVVQSAL